ncbi:MAG TPA: tol-pal system-associated acyl-CoA thioesterase [Gammaproteobacteria bacterium]|nr:tol-pal system-associated acyl-CoA thioesterase [Gammaproteobacteria bacterium]
MSTLVGEWPVRVYYEDTDHGGGVYYANYLKFFERGRTELLRAVGFEQDELARETGILFVVRRVTVDYLRPAVFNDALRVVTEIGELGRSRVDFAQRIHREGEDSPLCQGTVRIACVTAEEFRPARIPERVRAALGSEE